MKYESQTIPAGVVPGSPEEQRFLADVRRRNRAADAGRQALRKVGLEEAEEFNRGYVPGGEANRIQSGVIAVIEQPEVNPAAQLPEEQ